MTAVESIGLLVGRVVAGVGLLIFPFLLLNMLFVITTVLFISPVFMSLVVILIGLIPDAIVKYRAKSSEPVEDNASNGSAVQGINAIKTKNNRMVRCVLVYVAFVVALAVASVVMLHRYSLWSFEDALIAVLYLPNAEVQGTSMGLHVRVPEPNPNSQFHVSYWRTDSPDSPTTTKNVPLNVTQGGFGDVVLVGLDTNVEYSYQVAVQKDSDSLFAPRDRLSGTFRAMPAPTDDTLTFVSTSCIMLQMSLGRQATAFNELLGRGAQLGLFLGDFIYLDVPWHDHAGPGEEWKLRNRYRHMFTQHDVQNVLGSMPFAWIFDDHEITNDYVAEQLTDTYIRAIKEWRLFVGDRNPYDPVTDVDECVLALTASSNGTDSSEIQAQCETALQQHFDRMSFQRADHYQFRTGPARFFVADTRRFRFGDTMLGVNQTAEIVQWIRDASTETVSFLVSPSPWTLNYYGGWACCEAERNEILDAVEEVKRDKGVTFVLVSGDQHRPGIYELRPGIFEISASPIDGTTTALEQFDFESKEIDRTVFERPGFNNVFAFWNVNTTHVAVDIYAGGRDLAAVVGLCLFGAMLFLSLLAWGCWKPKSYVLAILSVALFIGLVVLAVVSASNLDEPMFSFAVER